MRYFRLLCDTIGRFFYLLSHHNRLFRLVNGSLCDNDFFDVFLGRNLKHKFEQHIFENGSQSSCAGVELNCLCGNRSQRVGLSL